MSLLNHFSTFKWLKETKDSICMKFICIMNLTSFQVNEKNAIKFSSIDLAVNNDVYGRPLSEEQEGRNPGG